MRDFGGRLLVHTINSTKGPQIELSASQRPIGIPVWLGNEVLKPSRPGRRAMRCGEAPFEIHQAGLDVHLDPASSGLNVQRTEPHEPVRCNLSVCRYRAAA